MMEQHPSSPLVLNNDMAYQQWNRLSTSINSLSIGEGAGKFAKGFNSTVQSAKERLGQVAPDEITELPQGKVPGSVTWAWSDVL